MADPTDAVLVAAVGRREQGALAELYRRHGGSVFSLALRVMRDRELADDVVQEIFLRLWRAPQRFDSDRGSLRSFLLAQTHSRSVDVVRSESARRGREERDAKAVRVAYDLEEEALMGALGRQVREAMGVLSAVERTAISLAYFGNHTYRDVAVLLDLPEGTVKSRIRTGLLRLRSTLIGAGIESS